MNNLGKIVKANYATDGTYGRGRIIAYCPYSTYVIERDNGTRFSWRCDLSEVLEDDRPVLDMREIKESRKSPTLRPFIMTIFSFDKE